jgi:hypothetical protein
MKTEMRTTKGTKLSKFQGVLWMARPISRRLFLSDSEQFVLYALANSFDGSEGAFQPGEFAAMVRTQPG